MSTARQRSTKATTARRKLPRAERERQMLKVAARVFGERGFHAASMEEIADGVGVTKPMLYAYFGSKEGLYLAVIDQAGSHLVKSVGQLASVPDPVRRVRLAAEFLLRYIERHRDGWAVLFREGVGSSNQVVERMASYRAQIVSQAAAAFAGIQGDHDDPEVLKSVEPMAHALLGAGEALARWWLSQPAESSERMQAAIMALVDGMIAGLPGLLAGRPSSDG